jgi:hypothetical protein
MTVKDVLDIVIIPVVLAILALAWPVIQSWYRRRAFQNLILRELEELEPFPEEVVELKELEHYPEDAETYGWWAHQKKDFVHQKILQDVSENRDFILSLEPDLVYFISQLWDAKRNKDDQQWLYYLCKLSNPKYDRNEKIADALKKWKVLCEKYRTQTQQPPLKPIKC